MKATVTEKYGHVYDVEATDKKYDTTVWHFNCTLKNRRKVLQVAADKFKSQTV